MVLFPLRSNDFIFSLLRTTFTVVRMFYSCKTFIQRACDRFFKFTIVVLVQICPEAHSCAHLVTYIYAKLGLQAPIIFVYTFGSLYVIDVQHLYRGKPVFLNLHLIS